MSGAIQKSPLDKKLSSVSFGMLTDYLSEYTVLHQPKTGLDSFKLPVYASAVSYSQVALQEYEILYVVDENSGHQFLKNHPCAFSIILVSESKAPKWVENFLNQTIVIASNDDMATFFSSIQSFFLKILLWNNELDRIVSKNGQLQELFDASESIFRHFIYATDSGHALLGYTKDISPPNQTIESLGQESYCSFIPSYSPSKNRFIQIPATEDFPFERINCLISVNGMNFACVEMVCGEDQFTDGVKDLFGVFCDKFTDLCKPLWKDMLLLDTPFYPLFERLISGEHVTASFLAAQVKQFQIPHIAEFKMLIISPEQSKFTGNIQEVARAAAKLNKRDSFCLLYQNDLIVLCYSLTSDSQISNTKIAEELDESIFQPFGLITSSSQVFSNFKDLRYAYRQAKLTFEFKETIDAETMFCHSEAKRFYYPFEEALVYFLLTRRDTDPEFLAFSLSHTILEKIHATI